MNHPMSSKNLIEDLKRGIRERDPETAALWEFMDFVVDDAMRSPNPYQCCDFDFEHVIAFVQKFWLARGGRMCSEEETITTTINDQMYPPAYYNLLMHDLKGWLTCSKAPMCDTKSWNEVFYEGSLAYNTQDCVAPLILREFKEFIEKNPKVTAYTEQCGTIKEDPRVALDVLEWYADKMKITQL